MGWLWNNPKPATAEGHATTERATSEQATPPLTHGETPPNRRGKTRDEIAEAELHAFLKELQEPLAASPSPKQPRDQQEEAASHSPAANAIQPYPTTMSCTTYFDAAWFCQLPGGQFVNVYRYGSFRKCSDSWSRFWFCMRTNRGFMTEEKRVRRIKEFHKKRERELLKGPNSEQVWEARKTMHPRPFGVDYDRDSD